ncbi:glycosyltransferase [Porphyrobacter sp. LM 6]|uniref:glycosyltransferase n=1 Tax=Porphyrobacter sp. LM 6 TaxID=1896196 RepID=UPI00086389C7|nr:glycosyltransferase [Porphyrobacter sp. LM 6]AOL94046.1 Glycosyltransferase involved in cell wall biosynthesis [Porphyrobacter sp. LM 6]
MNILVVGNGFTRLELPDGHYVNHHTAKFLVDLAASGREVTLAQSVQNLPSQAGLNNARLPEDQVRSLDLNKRSPAALWRALRETIAADFVYLFYPGRWPHLLGTIRRWLGRPYGLYVRGERFENGGSAAKLFKAAKLICAETGLDDRLAPHNPNVVAIAPMLDMTAQDVTAPDFSNIAESPLRVLFVGRIEEAKGIQELIDAAHLLKARRFDFTMRLVGGGPLYGDLVNSLQQPGAPDIAMCGLVADKAELMAHYTWADVLILPSHHEGFPRVLFEGMLKSCVIVTTMVGGIPSLMKDGINCRALPLRDPVAIADILEALPRDPAFLLALANAGRETVLEILQTRPTQIDAVNKVLNARN